MYYKKKTIYVAVLCCILFVLSGCALFGGKSAKQVTGTIMEIEKYGHAVLDISVKEFAEAGYAPGDIVTVEVGAFQAEMPYYTGYYSKPKGLMVRGEDMEDTIALCINYGDFSEMAGAKVGDQATITLKEKAGALDIQEISSLEYLSYERSDFESDAVFANFRAVTAGNIAPETLYRGSSPINNKYGRAKVANQCVEEAKIATVLNLSDSDEKIKELFLTEDFESLYYRELYEGGHVLALDLASDFYSKEFSEKLIQGFEFLAENEPPYLLHCQEGKDRAGFATMLLESLTGAELDEIIADYMISFDNYFGVSEQSDAEKYHAIIENNLLEMLLHVTGADSMDSLRKVNMEEAATKYLLENGMEEEKLQILKDKLTK